MSKARRHWWLVVSKETGLSVSNQVHYSGDDARRYWRSYPNQKKARKVIKVVPASEAERLARERLREMTPPENLPDAP